MLQIQLILLSPDMKYCYKLFFFCPLSTHLTARTQRSYTEYCNWIPIHRIEYETIKTSTKPDAANKIMQDDYQVFGED